MGDGVLRAPSFPPSQLPIDSSWLKSLEVKCVDHPPVLSHVGTLLPVLVDSLLGTQILVEVGSKGA